MTKTPYTRADFDRLRAEVKAVESREGLPLAAFAVGLGLGQLLLLRWAETNFTPGAAKLFAGTVFLVYAAIVVWMIWRYVARVNAARPRCPQCGVVMQNRSLGTAAATGNCDACGGRVIAA